MWKFIAVVGLVVCMGSSSAMIAHAQIGGDLLPPLPLPSESPAPASTPTSSPTGVTEIPTSGGIASPSPSTLPDLNGGNVPPVPSLAPQPSPSPTADPTNAGKSHPGRIIIPGGSGGGDSGGSGTSPDTRPTIGANMNLKDQKGTFSGSSSSSPSARDGSGAARSYGAVARRAAVTAAGRAIDLAGPLAAPVLVALAMLLLLAALGRGSERFGKLEQFTSKKAYRL